MALTPDEKRRLMELAARRSGAAPAAQQQAQPWKSYGGVLGKIQDLSEGIGASALKTYYGGKELLGLAEQDDRTHLKLWQDAAGESGWGMAGEVTGDIAQLAIPGTAGVKAATAIPKAMRWAQGMKAGTRLGADVAGSAGLGAVQLPSEDGSRSENAFMYGAGALGGAALGKTLNIAATGIKGSPAAQRLRAEGVKLTAGQQNEVLRRIEGFMNLLPFTAKGVERSRERSYNSLLRKMQNKADPEERLFNKSLLQERMSPKEINAAMYKSFNDGYATAWGSTAQVTSSGVTKMGNALTSNLHKMTNGQQKAITRLAQELEEKLMNPANSLKDVDDLLRAYRKNPGKDPAKVRVYNQTLSDVRAALRGELPEQNQQLLSKLDEKYRKFKVLQNASTAAAAERRAGVLTLEDLQAGNRQATSQFQRSMGQEPFGSMLDDYAKARGQPKEPLLGVSRAIVKEIPDAFQTRHLQSVLGGTAPWQKPIRDWTEKHYPGVLRKWYSAARLGGAAAED